MSGKSFVTYFSWDEKSLCQALLRFFSIGKSPILDKTKTGRRLNTFSTKLFAVSKFNSHFLATLLFMLLNLIGGALNAQPFILRVAEQNLEKVDFGTINLADIDRDGKLDVAVIGLTRSIVLKPIVSLVRFENEVDILRPGGVIDVITTYGQPTGTLGLTGIWMGSSDWSDLDGDGELDLIMIGAKNLDEPFVSKARIAFDLGGLQYLDQVIDDIQGVRNNCMAVTDFDGDAEKDVLVAGIEDNGNYSTRLYLHSNQFNFTEEQTGIPGFAYCDIDYGDIDNDGDNDFLISGITFDGYRSFIYTNDGNAMFTRTNNDLEKFGYSSAGFADFDLDGDLDLALAGAQPDPHVVKGFIKIYLNDGHGNYSESAIEVKGAFYGDIKWADFTNDGFPDLYISGAETLSGDRVGRIYVNMDGRHLRLVVNAGEFLYSSAAVGDYDGDGDVDIFQSASFRTNQFRNDQTIINTPPRPPSELSVELDGNSVSLTWISGTDDQSGSQGLSYNLLLKKDGNIVSSPLSLQSTGTRLSPKPGNMGLANAWKLSNLEIGNYEVMVQSIDQSFIGSPFSEPIFFEITTGGTSPPRGS